MAAFYSAVIEITDKDDGGEQEYIFDTVSKTLAL